jgi:hypothetical protein
MTIIERVKLAIAKGAHEQDGWEHAARLAIAAMREPTDEMINAGMHKDGRHGWQAMIDEALK